MNGVQGPAGPHLPNVLYPTDNQMLVPRPGWDSVLVASNAVWDEQAIQQTSCSGNFCLRGSQCRSGSLGEFLTHTSAQAPD